MKRWELLAVIGGWAFIVFGLYAANENRKADTAYHQACDAMKGVDL